MIQTFRLKCGHEVRFTYKPKYNELLWCERCEKWTPQPFSDRVTVKCQDCSYERKVSTPRMGGALAQSHSKRRNHTCGYAFEDHKRLYRFGNSISGTT